MKFTNSCDGSGLGPPNQVNQMAVIKALVPGFLLTFVVSLVIGSQGSQGGMLVITHTYYQGHELYWSWPLFLGATGLAWAIFSLME